MERSPSPERVDGSVALAMELESTNVKVCGRRHSDGAPSLELPRKMDTGLLSYATATAGAIGQPGGFYAGYPGGGVWKTTSAGATWTPVFDSVRNVSSIGAVAVAPSNSDVVYVGTGDMITAGTIEQGNGVYKSTDAGKSWQHLGLDKRSTFLDYWLGAKPSGGDHARSSGRRGPRRAPSIERAHSARGGGSLRALPGILARTPERYARRRRD